MAFDGTEGAFITLEEGTSLTQKYRNDFLVNGRTKKAIFFGKSKLMDLLNQTDCKGLRIYFGAEQPDPMKPVELALVLVGAKADETDMIGANDKILDRGTPCPTQCDLTSALNGSTSSSTNSPTTL